MDELKQEKNTQSRKQSCFVMPNEFYAHAKYVLLICFVDHNQFVLEIAKNNNTHEISHTDPN